MKLRTVKCWTTRTGTDRYIRLYRAWWNMKSRVGGKTTSSSGTNYWIGLQITFKDWLHFREWSLTNGYSSIRCSLDREKSDQGYTPGNCRWVTRGENSGFTATTRAENMAILRFQQQAVTPEEQHELDTALGIWHCPLTATYNPR